MMLVLECILIIRENIVGIVLVCLDLLDEMIFTCAGHIVFHVSVRISPIAHFDLTVRISVLIKPICKVGGNGELLYRSNLQFRSIREITPSLAVMILSAEHNMTTVGNVVVAGDHRSSISE